MNDIYYSSTEATGKIIMVIAVAIVIITTIIAIITTTIRARRSWRERSAGGRTRAEVVEDGRGREEGGGRGEKLRLSALFA